MNRSLSIAGLVVAVGLAAGCSSVRPLTSCEPSGGVTPFCGYQNPEDLARLPDGRHLLVSEYGSMEKGEAGRLSLLEMETRERRVLFESGTPRGAGSWGADDCEGPPAIISPHGIHLARRRDGALQLLVVQHAERESVEIFEVRPAGAAWALAWRGCVTPPEDAWLNDIAAIPDGGFVVTHMMTKRSGLAQSLALGWASLFGSDTGHLLQWQPAAGFSVVPGTEGPMPNGVEISPDGASVFVNYSIGSEVRRVNRRSGGREASAPVPMPDNSTWSADGRLLVASLRMSSGEFLACQELESGACPVDFAIVSLDPETLASEVVFARDADTPGGAGTVGLEARGALWIGTFAGDRILRVESGAR